jgi:hypothetical protein
MSWSWRLDPQRRGSYFLLEDGIEQGSVHLLRDVRYPSITLRKICVALETADGLNEVPE